MWIKSDPRWSPLGWVGLAKAMSVNRSLIQAMTSRAMIPCPIQSGGTLVMVGLWLD